MKSHLSFILIVLFSSYIFAFNSLSESNSASLKESSSKRVLVPISDGFEEVELVSIVDILRRAGADVNIASITKKRLLTGQNGITIKADIPFSKHGEFDMIVLPGGGVNAASLGSFSPLVNLIQKTLADGKFVAAICASPVLVLEKNGFLKGIDFSVSYPTMMEQLSNPHPDKPDLHHDKLIITSQGPGTSIKFALYLVETLFGREKAEQVSEEFIAKPHLHSSQ